MDFSRLLIIEQDDLYEHLYNINVHHKPRAGQHLGYIDKSQNEIEITLPNAQIDLNITQSISSLSSAIQTSSTGFICWQAATKFADWVLSDAKCPLQSVIKGSNILELGAGTGAVLASTLGPSCRHYIASDQKHILKLMKTNFLRNVMSRRYSSSTCENESTVQLRKNEQCKIDFIELDWEHTDSGAYDYRELTGAVCPDVILACDTIYNEFLIPHFVYAMKLMMSGETLAVVAMQLREESILESFLEAVYAEDLMVYVVPDELLSPDLLQGFVVYCFAKK